MLLPLDGVVLACPSGSNNGATYSPPVPDFCFTDKDNGVRTPGYPSDFCRCRSWAVVWYHQAAENFQVNILDGAGAQVQVEPADAGTAWPYPGGLRVNYKVEVNGTFNEGHHLIISQDLPSKAVNARNLLTTGGPGDTPLNGIVDPGCNTMKFMITGGRFQSTNFSMIFGGGTARLPFMVHPYTLDGDTTSATAEICLGTS